MTYVGIHTQQRRNDMRSLLLLVLFPCLIVVLVYLFFFIFLQIDDTKYYEPAYKLAFDHALQAIPMVLLVVGIWFVIAYFINVGIINNATGAKPLERKENKRIYNLVENLCMTQGMAMPKVNIIETDGLNAYASGINKKSYTVTLTRGIIDRLDDDELEGVIAHELSHIKNHDVRLLIISIVFVGIFTFVAQVAVRSILFAPRSRSSNNKNGGSAILLFIIVAALAAIGYFFSLMMRFAISRKREYLADASAAEMTKKPRALASALAKISKDPNVDTVKRDDVAQLFIEHPKMKASGKIGSLFATHPPVAKRIEVLEQF